MSGFSSQPPVETMMAIFAETHYHANLDMDALKQVCKYFVDLAPKRQLSHHQADNIIDPEVLLHHIPGGMISNLRSQLAQQNALEKIDEVFEELPRVRADLGYPPLVTPTSQIIGIQAVMNVISGKRYELVSQEIRDYVRGLYGRSPAPIDAGVQKKILGKEKPITGRPADLLAPMLPNATEGIDPKLIKKEEDIISYCLFPEVSLAYFKWRALPADQRPPIPADLELKQEKETDEKPEPAPVPPRPFLAQTDYQALNELLTRVHELNLNEFTIRRDDLSISLKGSGMTAATQSLTPQSPSQSNAVAMPDKKLPPPAKTEAKPEAPPGLSINAPLNGTFYLSSGPGKPPLCQEGGEVKAGETVCIVEAMKLFNAIKAPCNCRILKIHGEHGKPVKKDDPMIRYEKLS
jgi:oxaloacetate decarboxylase alpha subunit